MAEKSSDKSEWQIEDRWTPKLAKKWTPISYAFLEFYSQLNPPITSGEAMFIVHVMAHKWKKAAPYPSFKTLGKRMGITHTQARNYARSLDTKGYLRRKFRVGRTNRFYFEGLYEALERCLDAKQPEREDEDD